MLQEYPTQIQPRSSAARRESDAFELPVPLKIESSTGVDAEAASRILIDLANQDTSEDTLNDNSHKIMTTKRRASSFSKGGGVSLPIKTDVNLHLQQERNQPDPIMLLAAAAAVIDNDTSSSYKRRSYERREIKLASRHYAKRKSFTYGSTIQEQQQQQQVNEGRHRYQQKRHYSMQIDHPNTWSSSFSPRMNVSEEEEDEEIKEEEEEEEESEQDLIKKNSNRRSGAGRRASSHNHHYKRGGGYESQQQQQSTSNTQSAFSWQFLNMRQNPRIKRNAMHAYITYMIYTDRSNKEDQQTTRLPYHHHSHSQRHQLTTTSSAVKEEKMTTNNSMDWYPASTSTTTTSGKQQAYRLPPSPRQQQQQQQRHDMVPPPTTPNTDTIGNSRPLTDFLFNRSSSPSLPPPPPF